MKNKVKLICILAFSMIILTGCTQKSLKEVAIEYFEEVKLCKNQEVNNYFVETIKFLEQPGDSSYEVSDNMKISVNEFMPKIEVDIIREQAGKDSATVNIEVKGINIRTVLGEVLAQKAIYGEDRYLDDMDCLIEKIKSSKIETREGVMCLNKVDNEWEVENDEELMMLIVGKIEDTDIFNK